MAVALLKDVASGTGSTPRPKGEEVQAEHAGIAGEVSSAALAGTSQEVHQGSGEPYATPTDAASFSSTTQAEEFKIVRASMKIAVDVADLATDPKAHIQRTCGGVESECRACLMLVELRRARQLVAHAYNVAMRLHWRVDADTVDRFQIAHQRAPKTAAEWMPAPSAELMHALRSVLPGTARGSTQALADQVVRTWQNKEGRHLAQLYTYPAVRAACPTLSSNVAAYIYRQAEKKWIKTRWDALVKNDCSPPHYKRSVPIPVPAQNVTLQRDQGQWYTISFSLHSKTHNKAPAQFKFRIRARDKKMRELLDSLTHPLPEQRWKLGAIQIQEDRVRPGRWYFRFAYTRKVGKVERTERVAAINRGIVSFLVALTSNGREFIYDGTDIIARLKYFQRKRKEHQRQLRASQRGGHGRKKSLRPIEKYRTRFENWRGTHNQNLARRFATWCKDRNVTLVYIEDFSGIRDSAPEKLEGGEWVWRMLQEWPYYELGMRIVACLEELGIPALVLPPKDISRLCPECGYTDKANIDLKNRLFRCQAEGCSYKRHLDVTACRNLLARAAECEQSGDARGAREKKTRKSKKTPGKNGTARKPSGKSLKS